MIGKWHLVLKGFYSSTYVEDLYMWRYHARCCGGIYSNADRLHSSLKRVNYNGVHSLQ